MALTKASYYMISGAAKNVLDYGADPTGATESTAAIQAAIDAAAGGTVYLPSGTYLVGNLNSFNYAGTQIVGESKYTTIIKAKSGITGSVFRNSNSGIGTSAYNAVRCLRIDLGGQNLNAVDFSSVNNSVAEELYVIGGTSIGTANGNGIRFGAPLNFGAYSNCVQNCTFVYLGKGVLWGQDANQNIVIGGEVITCIVGLDTAPGGIKVDTPKVFGTRIENCTTGLYEGAIYGFYCGLRFEDNGTDITFEVGSDHPQIVGGYTASSPITLSGLSNADSPIIQSSDLGWYEIETSVARPIQLQGKRVFTAPGTTLPSAPTGSYAAYFEDDIWLKNNLWFKSRNAAGTGQVLALQVDTNNELNLRSFNSVGSVDAPVNIGGGASVRPISDNVTSLGTSAKRWSNVVSSEITVVDGIAEPATIAGHAQIYVDTADGDLKIKFGDGTVKTIVVDT